MNKFLVSVAAATLIASAASASTIGVVQIEYDDQGVAVSGTNSSGADFVGSVAVPVDGPTQPEFFGTDGANDLNFISQFGTQGILGIDSRVIFEGISTRIFQSGDLAMDEDNNLIIFEEGDSVDASSFNGTNDSGNLYGGSQSPIEALPNVGDSGIFGFRFSFIEQYIGGCEIDSDVPCICDVEFEEECVFQVFDGAVEELFGEEDELPIFEEYTIATYYGFVNVTHGSVVPGSLFIQTRNNVAATIAITDDPQPVPLPAAGWLLLAGLGGLGAMRRRKKA